VSICYHIVEGLQTFLAFPCDSNISVVLGLMSLLFAFGFGPEMGYWTVGGLARTVYTSIEMNRQIKETYGLDIGQKNMRSRQVGVKRQAQRYW
jgi:hypothetical protein